MKILKITLSFVIVMLLGVSTAMAGGEIRLNFTNGIYTDEALVALRVGAMDEFDMYDSPKMAVNVVDYPELYSFAGTKQVAINGIAPLTYNEVKVISLGYRIGLTSTLTIQVKNIANLDSGTVVYLKDNDLNVEKELITNVSYTFTTNKGENNSRFSLVIKRYPVVQPVVTSTITPSTITTDTVATSTVTTTSTNTTTTTTTASTDTVSAAPVVAPVAAVTPDFNVLVTGSRTLEVQLLNIPIKNTKITVNSITGRRMLVASATGDITYLTTPLPKGQYVVTVNNRNITKSKNIVVN